MRFENENLQNMAAKLTIRSGSFGLADQGTRSCLKREAAGHTGVACTILLLRRHWNNCTILINQTL